MEELIYKSDARRAILKMNPDLAYCIEGIRPVTRLVDEISTMEIVDKIASFIEKEENWPLLKDCWIVNDRSDDLRALLKRALES